MDKEDLIRRIIGAAIAVHKELGPVYLESVYEAALCIELGCQGIQFECQKSMEVLYRGRKVGEHRLDLVVEGLIVIENKAVQALDKVFFVVVRSYLKATGLKDALILNFATMPLTIKRVGCEDTLRYLADD